MLLICKILTKNIKESLFTVYNKKNKDNKKKFEYCKLDINLRNQTKFFKQIYK